MATRSPLLDALGGEAGCHALSAAFYARVPKDPVLRPFFPGKTQKCAIEAFASFLIQFLEGDEDQTQHRESLSLFGSHVRFHIGPPARRAWLAQMSATLDAFPVDASTRAGLKNFFDHTSAYIIGDDTAPPEHPELAARWNQQRILDAAIAAIFAGRDAEAVAIAPRFVPRPSVFVGLLARMVESGRPALIRFVLDSCERHPSLAIAHAYSGRTLLHYAAGAGSLDVVTLLLRLGMNPDIQDRGSHTALYAVANGCSSDAGPAIVEALVRAGANVNACDGVTRATPLHMAARRGHTAIARVLLDSGADIDARDIKRDTPLQRAINCRKPAVAQLIKDAAARRSS